MAQTSMTVRMDNQQKARFDELCTEFGMSANTAINIFVRAVIRTGSIPFNIQTEPAPDKDEVTTKAMQAFENIRKSAKENNVHMTLEEINAEIKEVRRLRKERDGSDGK
jgi:addiction module RelB/DinJ family antitoxin